MFASVGLGGLGSGCRLGIDATGDRDIYLRPSTARRRTSRGLAAITTTDCVHRLNGNEGCVGDAEITIS
jgi:hypothetical protein